jgi:hypothetical protein
MKRQFIVIAIATAALLWCSISFAADAIKSQRIHFSPGKSSATINGSISGDKAVDYKLAAKSGQTMSVKLETSNLSNYFNVLPPGSESALFIGSTSGNEWTGTLPADGDYTIRVYLMRSAGRRDEKADYTMTVGITGGAAAAAPSTDAKVAGTSYHATGNIPCSMGGGQPTGSCPFGVKREGSGAGIVYVTKPDGRTRMIFFEKGKATGYDQSQADTGKFRAEKQGDLNIIHIGQERYEIPDAVIFGG